MTAGFNSAAVVDFLIETRSLPALARRYHRDFAFYVAYPISSIFPSYFILPWRKRATPSKRETDIDQLRKGAWLPRSFTLSTALNKFWQISFGFLQSALPFALYTFPPALTVII